MHHFAFRPSLLSGDSIANGVQPRRGYCWLKLFPPVLAGTALGLIGPVSYTALCQSNSSPNKTHDLDHKSQMTKHFHEVTVRPPLITAFNERLSFLLEFLKINSRSECRECKYRFTFRNTILSQQLVSFLSFFNFRTLLIGYIRQMIIDF